MNRDFRMEHDNGCGLVCLAVLLATILIVTAANGAENIIEIENSSDWDDLAAMSPVTEERVIDLPQDSKKWYISVIGNPSDLQYKSILRRFLRNAHLRALKVQVHFWIVPSNGEAFRERYKKNTKELPTIRVQKSNGNVVWEASGKGIPLTAEGLYIAIKNSSLKAMAILPWRRNGTILPWRDHMEHRAVPQPRPEPALVPVLVDPEPAPIDDGGVPEFEETGPARWVVVLTAIASALAGAGLGLFGQWRRVNGVG